MKTPIPPPVKHIAHKQQQMGFGNLSDPVAEKNDRGEEVKKENVAVKYHQRGQDVKKVILKILEIVKISISDALKI